MAPEYAMEGSFSVKSDTYSFGVLLLDIVSGLKIGSPHLIMDFPNLIAYVSTEEFLTIEPLKTLFWWLDLNSVSLVQAWSLWEDGNARELVDLSILESSSLQEVIRCIRLGLLCVQDNPNARPLMSSIVFMLQNETAPQRNLYILLGIMKLVSQINTCEDRWITWVSQL